MDGRYDDGFELWRGKIASHPRSWTAKRNLAIAESIYVERKHGRNIADSAKYWKEILETDRQWDEFEKLYNLYNEHVSHANFEKLRKRAGKILSDYYAEISLESKNDKIIAKFNDIVNIRGDVFDNKILKPLLVEYVSLGSKIDSTNPEELFLESKRRKISRSLNDYISRANMLIDKANSLGHNCWVSSIVAVRREDLADSSRRLANGLCKNIYSYLGKPSDVEVDIATLKRSLTYAGRFYEIASKFVYSEKLKTQIERDDCTNYLGALIDIRAKNNKRLSYLRVKREIADTLARWRRDPDAKRDAAESAHMVKLIDEVLPMEEDADERAALNKARREAVSRISHEEEMAKEATSANDASSEVTLEEFLRGLDDFKYSDEESSEEYSVDDRGVELRILGFILLVALLIFIGAIMCQ